MTPTPTPERIVESNGHVHVGWFDKPFRNANLHDAKPQHALAALGGALAPLERGFRRLRLKEWQYVSVVSERALFACAVVNVGYLGSAFAYVVDRESGEKFEWAAKLPPSRNVAVSRSSVEGVSRFERAGWGHIEIRNHPQTHERVLSVRLHGELGQRAKPPLRAQLRIQDRPEAIQPVVVVEQTAPEQWLYTHKSYGLTTTGSLQCGALNEQLSGQQALAGFDYNRGYRGRKTWWNWAAAAGRDQQGQTLGFNLTAHRPWTDQGSRRNTPPDAADCGIWLAGKLTKIERVDFAYNPSDLLAPWHIFDAEGLVDLRFTPRGKRSENVNAGLLVSRFHQPYGRFSGTLKDRSGQAVQLGDVFGVTEQHYAVW